MDFMTILFASVELCSQDNIDDNLQVIEHAVIEASVHQAKFIVLPENACLMGQQLPLALRFDEICHWYSDLASRYQVHLLAGTLPCPFRPCGEKITNGKFRQSSLLFDPNGALVARYDKIHLFKATVADSVGQYDEGRTFEAGDTSIVAPCWIDNQKVNIGMMVCFDVRFSSLSKQLRQLGADVLCLPSAFTYITGKLHWQTLLQARALDSQCLVIGSAQGGRHYFYQTERVKNQRKTWGHSMIVDANGQVVASTHGLKTAKKFNITYGALDLNKQQKIRQSLPLF